MLWLFKKMFDPNAAREEEAAQKRQREAWPPDVSPDQIDGDQPLPEAEPVLCVCKLCGYEEMDAQFCPTCLAETMVLKT